MSDKAIGKITAKEARQISEANKIPLEKAIEQIHTSAKTGSKLSIFHNLHDEEVLELVRLEFKVSKFTDFAGVQLTKVEW